MRQSMITSEYAEMERVKVRMIGSTTSYRNHFK